MINIRVIRNIIALSLFGLGVSIALIPFLKDKADIDITNQIVEKWEEDISNELNNQELEVKECYTESDCTLINELDGVNGIIEIPIIDLKLPILHGAIHDNMKYSVATMTHKKPLDGVNFTVAGHRNIRKGKNFNRLNEVKIGDEIIVKNNDKIYSYNVVDKFIVEPSEIEILEDTGKTEITLITCYPITISTHRLVIKGEAI